MRKSDDEFKREAIKKIHDGQSVASVARALGVAESLLHNWKRQAVEASSDSEREVIVGDITYLPLRSGKWGYLASWQDKVSKRMVGWAVAARMSAELVTSAFSKAVSSGCVTNETIIHTDQSPIPTSMKRRIHPIST